MASFDFLNAGTGAFSGAASGAAIGTALGSPGIGTAVGAGAGALLGGFLSDEPETDFWENYQNLLKQLRGDFRAQARSGVEQAARRSSSQLAARGLSTTTTGTIRPNLIRAQTGAALGQADIAASKLALAGAQAGSTTTQKDISGIFSGASSLAQSLQLIQLLKSLQGGGATTLAGSGSQSLGGAATSPFALTS